MKLSASNSDVKPSGNFLRFSFVSVRCVFVIIEQVITTSPQSVEHSSRYDK
ncbi:MAG: hypothetical protein ABIJ10_01035 [Candidatus Micrarchaeota archaeon]